MNDYEKSILPFDSATRKAIPLVTGLLDYFPAALAAVAEVSLRGNEKHNPGQPLHHNRGKSGDHADAELRHLMDRGRIDPDSGCRHSAEGAWRALALLQEELERDAGAPVARGAGPRCLGDGGRCLAAPGWPHSDRCKAEYEVECQASAEDAGAALRTGPGPAQGDLRYEDGQTDAYRMAPDWTMYVSPPLVADMEAKATQELLEDRRDWLRGLLGREPTEEDLRLFWK